MFLKIVHSEFFVILLHNFLNNILVCKNWVVLRSCSFLSLFFIACFSFEINIEMI